MTDPVTKRAKAETTASSKALQKLEGANATRELTTSCEKERRTSIAEVSCVSEKMMRDATTEEEHGEEQGKTGSGMPKAFCCWRTLELFLLCSASSTPSEDRVNREDSQQEVEQNTQTTMGTGGEKEPPRSNNLLVRKTILLHFLS